MAFLKTRLCLLCIFALSLTASSQSELKLAFGSCSKVTSDQHLWNEIADYAPDMWIWLGDNIYADTEDMDKMKAKYDKQDQIRGYADLKTKTMIAGIWDDHDYGLNDGGKEYPKKKESRDLLFEFIDLPKDHEAWDREGAYHDHTIKKGDLTVDILITDGRYFKEVTERKDGVYASDPDAELLGEEQWKWLVKKMHNSKADLIILVSGIQIIPDEHRFEKWANHPTDRNRLFGLIADIETPVIALSGDRHRGEIMQHIIGEEQYLLEITSSSLTHTYAKDGEPNRFRQGPLVIVDNFGGLWIKKSENGIKVVAELISEGSKVESREERLY